MVGDVVNLYPYRKHRSPQIRQIKDCGGSGCIKNLQYIQDQTMTLISTNININEYITEVFKHLMEITGSSYGFLAKISEKERYKLHCHCVFTKFTDTITDTTESCKNTYNKDSLVAFSIRKKMSAICTDPERDPRAKYSGKTSRSYLSIPLFNVDGKIISVIILETTGSKYSITTLHTAFPLLVHLESILCNLYKHGLEFKNKIWKHQEITSIKDTFLSTMSHEIRTPLNGIVSATNLLYESKPLTKQQELYINILNECTSQLLSLISDILDFGRINDGTIIFNKDPFNIKDCIQSSLDIVKHRADSKNLPLIVDIPSDIPERVVGDVARLRQVIINIVGNAIKFTDSGSVTVKVVHSKIESKNSYMWKTEISVTDTGRGIEMKDKDRIFDMFTKIQDNDNFDQGLGLGLAISKKLVELMNGEINVVDNPGGGCIFTFSAIFEPEININEVRDMNANVLKNKVVIVVDDDETNRIMLMAKLVPLNLKVFTFASGREALAFIGMGVHFDLAIIDIYMPSMSGIKLVQAIRERDHSQPVIGMSSVGVNIPGKEWFDYFMEKPVNERVLCNTIINCLKGETAGLNRKESNLTRTSSDLTKDTIQIIVAEDDYYNRLLMKDTLHSLGYPNVDVAVNGQECYEMVKKNYYHICLMDIQMPKMRGDEATKKIKLLPSYPFIVAVTASVLDSDISKYLACGMDAYIPKPVDKNQLKNVLGGLLKRL